MIPGITLVPTRAASTFFVVAGNQRLGLVTRTGTGAKAWTARPVDAPPDGPRFSADTRDRAVLALLEARREVTPSVTTASALRGHPWLPAALAASIPALYETEAIALAKKVAHVKFFSPVFTWFVFELDPTTGEAFGWVQNHSDPTGSEPGYFSLDEMRDLLVIAHSIPVYVERDLSWTPRPVPGGVLR